MDILKVFISSIINITAALFVISSIVDKKISFRKIDTYIIILFLSIIGTINFYYVNQYFRIIVITFALGMANYYLFKQKTTRTIVSTVLEQFIMFISEAIFATILVLILNEQANNLIETFFGSIIANVGISLIAIFIINLKIVKKSCLFLISKTDKIRINQSIFYGTTVIATCMIIFGIAYFEINDTIMLLIIILLMLLYGFIISKALSEKNDNIKIKAENEALINNLSDYENMLDYHRVSNHENKNQLLIVKNMINNKDKNIKEYIDTIIKDVKQDNEIILSSAKKIPAGGLQGIIYQKMLLMYSKNIKVELDVSKEVSKIGDLNIELMYKICKILGVFLDNAIEEVEKINNKTVSIVLYIDGEKLVIEISNYFESLLELDKFGIKGYSTKGKGHGYGLSLVKEIISKEPKIVNEKRIDKDIFTQVLKIEYKKM